MSESGTVGLHRRNGRDPKIWDEQTKAGREVEKPHGGGVMSLMTELAIEEEEDLVMALA